MHIGTGMLKVTANDKVGTLFWDTV